MKLKLGTFAVYTMEYVPSLKKNSNLEFENMFIT